VYVCWRVHEDLEKMQKIISEIHMSAGANPPPLELEQSTENRTSHRTQLIDPFIFPFVNIRPIIVCLVDNVEGFTVTHFGSDLIIYLLGVHIAK